MLNCLIAASDGLDGLLRLILFFGVVSMAERYSEMREKRKRERGGAIPEGH